MTRIAAEVSDDTARALRMYLVKSRGSTKELGKVVEEMIVEGLNKRGCPVGA